VTCLSGRESSTLQCDQASIWLGRLRTARSEGCQQDPRKVDEPGYEATEPVFGNAGASEWLPTRGRGPQFSRLLPQ
jgi:hypothetical protein